VKIEAMLKHLKEDA